MKLILLCLLLLVGCVDKKPTPAPAPAPAPTPKPTTPSKPVTLKFAWDHEYNDWFLVEAIKKHGKNLLSVRPRDWKNYIDVYPTTEKELIKFWGNILVTMSYYESKWDGSKKYKENFRDRSGKYIYSRGLFQLGLESGLGYDCPFKTAQDIHNDSKNIECAVRILDRWVGRDKVIASGNPYRGGARYWAVLRGHREYTKKSLKAIQSANR